MTVQELIQALQELDCDDEVRINGEPINDILSMGEVIFDEEENEECQVGYINIV